MGKHVKIYEEIIEKGIEDVSEVELWICDELEKNSIKFETKIKERYEEETLTTDRYIMVYVDEDDIQAIERFIESEFLLTTKFKRNLTESQIEKIHDFDNDTENQEEKVSNDSLYSMDTFDEDLNSINKKISLTERITILGVCLVIFLMMLFGTWFVSEETFIKNISRNDLANIMIIVTCLICATVIIDIWILLSVRKQKKNFIKSITKELLGKYKYADDGISSEFFKEQAISDEYDFFKVKSSNKITGVIDEKEFVISDICLEKNPLFTSEYESIIVFDGVFLKGRNSRFFNNSIVIKQKDTIFSSYAIDEEFGALDYDPYKMSDEQVYRFFNMEYSIYIDGDGYLANEFNADFVREFMRINNNDKLNIKSCHFIADTVCLMIDKINVFIKYRDIKESGISSCNDIKNVEEVFLNNINKIKKCYDVALLFDYNKENNGSME